MTIRRPWGPKVSSGLLAILPLGGLWAQEAAPRPPASPAEYKARLAERQGKLQPGDPAPDFELPRVKASQTVRLSSWRGKKPVALVFGSYT